jgi:hypothetical protein
VVAHNDLDAGAAPLKAARNGYPRATGFDSADILDEGVDAEAWAFNDGVDFGGGLETYKGQEHRDCVSKWVQVHQIQDAPSLSETIPTGWTPIVTSSISISMPPRIIVRLKNTFAATCTQAASPHR